jgi:tRNA A37 threonylcarbamoyladenosine modification protein TsaB
MVISVANPILVGIYQDNILIETISKEGKTSDVLPTIFNDILQKYNINNIFYVNGPGSYMAIKIAYIFLKTLCIVKNISFKATDGFNLNDNSPIKALGKKYFFKAQNDKIIIGSLSQNDKLKDFILPLVLTNINFSDNTIPSYNLPVV